MEFGEFEEHIRALASIDSPELVTLKAHMLAQEALIRLLFARLELDEETMPRGLLGSIRRLSFPFLLKLALTGRGGIMLDETYNRCMSLNKIRNEYAHSLRPEGQEELIWDLISLKRPRGRRPRPDLVKAYRRALQSIVAVLAVCSNAWPLSPEVMRAVERAVDQGPLRVVKG